MGLKFSFGEDTESTFVIDISSAVETPLVLKKGQIIEVHVDGDLPIHLNLGDSNRNWYASLYLPEEGEEILEILVPYTGKFKLTSEVLTKEHFVNTSSDEEGN